MTVRLGLLIAIFVGLTGIACSPADQRKAERDMDEARRKVQPALHEAANEAKKDAKRAAEAIKREAKDLKRKAEADRDGSK